MEKCLCNIKEKIFKNIKPAKRVICLITMFTLFICNPCMAEDAAYKTTRIAICEDYNYETKKYTEEYLNKISKYSGLNFEYINCDTYESCIEMLKENKADLICGEKTESDFISSKAYGCIAYQLVALKESDLSYKNYDEFKNSVMGYTPDNNMADKFESYIEDNNIDAILKKYSNTDALLNGLYTGETDIAVINSCTDGKKLKVIDNFYYTSLNFYANKNEGALIEKINEAIIKTETFEPDFENSLLNHYFPEISQQPFSAAEIDSVAENNIYTIYLTDDEEPLAWYDSENGMYKGILADVCKMISEKTGLIFEYKSINEYEVREENFNAVCIASEDYDYIKTSDISGETNTILTEEFSLYNKKGEYFDTSKKTSYIVAVPKGYGKFNSFFAENYPDYTIIECNSIAQCKEYVLEGNADLTFLNDYVANRFFLMNNVTELEKISDTTCKLGIKLDFGGSNKDMAASIVNKGIGLIDKDKIQGIVLRYKIGVATNVTFSYILKNNLPFIMFLTGVFAVLIMLAIFGLVYARLMHNQKIQLEMANKAKNEFFSRMSHDMRTPMNGILGITEVAKEEKNSAILQQDMKKIRETGKYLLNLINDTLDFQKIESGKLYLEKEVIDVESSFENFFDMIGFTAKKKNIHFKIININVDLKCFVKIDVMKTKQVLANLLTNAIKFTPENGSVTITFECLKREKNISRVKIEISDTGIGMSENFINNKIFKPFSQEYNKASSNDTGTGLGLSIVKSLLDLMGGEIEVKSRLGEGSVFTIYMDFERVEIKGSSSENILKKETKYNEGMLKGKKILVFEDHPLNREIILKILEKFGCEAVAAENGEIGAKIFEDSHEKYFDAILMDVCMPIMDGYETTEKIRKAERCDSKTIPIIAMTANAYTEDVKRCIAAGMNGHLAKPVEAEKLYEILVKETTV